MKQTVCELVIHTVNKLFVWQHCLLFLL